MSLSLHWEHVELSICTKPNKNLVSFMQNSEDAEADIVRSRVDKSKICTLVLRTNNEMRRREAVQLELTRQDAQRCAAGLRIRS